MGGRLRVWLLPDIAFVGGVLTLAYGLVLFDGPRKLFRDSDAGWHIRTGESILDSGRLPAADPYSFSRGGEPWVAWEWGADLAMGLAHRAAGLGGVVLVYLCALALATWSWFHLHWRAGGHFLLACGMASLMLSTTNMHWLARPHVFGWVLVLAWVHALEWRGPYPRWALPAAAAFGAVWANLHASFLLLPLLGGAYAAGAWIQPLVWTGAKGRDWRPCALLGLAATAGTLANPYGWGLHRHVAVYLANARLLERIGEFQTFNFHTEGSTQILVTVIVGGAGAVLAWTCRRPEHAFVLAGFTILALRSARVLPLLALLLPLANGALTASLASASGLAAPVRRWRDAFLNYGHGLRRLDARFRGFAWAPVAVVLTFCFLETPSVKARTGFPPDEFPVSLAGAVERLPANARLFAPDKFGGYLIYRFSGRRPVYFDGRSDFYGLEFMEDYIDMVQLRPGWRRRWDQHRFTHALVPTRYALGPALEAQGWKVVARDPVAALLEAP